MKCAYCNSERGPFHKDHVVPRSRGGPDEPINIVIACAACNSAKGDRLPSEWLAHVPYLVSTIERRVSMIVGREARGGRRGTIESIAPPRLACSACARPLFPKLDGAHLAWWEDRGPPDARFDFRVTPLLEIEILCTGADACLRRKDDLMTARYPRRANLLDMPIDTFFGRWAWVEFESILKHHVLSRELLLRAIGLFRQLSKLTPHEEPPTEVREGDDPDQVDD